MKYLLMFCGTPENLKAWQALSEEERLQGLAQSAQWMARYHAQIRGSGALQLPHTITSVRAGADGHPLVTDGPFLEGTEVIGGYVELEVADLDEALRFAREWIGQQPAHPVVQIWPIVEE